MEILLISGPWWYLRTNQRRTKGQQLNGKLVSALFHSFWHFSTHFHTFSEFFRAFPPGLSLSIRGVCYCFSSKRLKRIEENKQTKTKPFCALVVARLSSSEQSPEEIPNVGPVCPERFFFPIKFPNLGSTMGANHQSRFLGRGCDEALFSEKKGFSVKGGEAIQ